MPRYPWWILNPSPFWIRYRFRDLENVLETSRIFRPDVIKYVLTRSFWRAFHEHKSQDECSDTPTNPHFNRISSSSIAHSTLEKFGSNIWIWIGYRGYVLAPFTDLGFEICISAQLCLVPLYLAPLAASNRGYIWGILNFAFVFKHCSQITNPSFVLISHDAGEMSLVKFLLNESSAEITTAQQLTIAKQV